VTARGSNRVSITALVATRPGATGRAWLIYRTHLDRGSGKHRREGFDETDYARLQDTATGTGRASRQAAYAITSLTSDCATAGDLARLVREQWSIEVHHHVRYDVSACAMATEDDAEWVADRVNKDSKACLTFTRYTSGTKGE